MANQNHFSLFLVLVLFFLSIAVESTTVHCSTEDHLIPNPAANGGLLSSFECALLNNKAVGTISVTTSGPLSNNSILFETISHMELEENHGNGSTYPFPPLLPFLNKSITFCSYYNCISFQGSSRRFHAFLITSSHHLLCPSTSVLTVDAHHTPKITRIHLCILQVSQFSDKFPLRFQISEPTIYKHQHFFISARSHLIDIPLFLSMASSIPLTSTNPLPSPTDTIYNFPLDASYHIPPIPIEDHTLYITELTPLLSSSLVSASFFQTSLLSIPFLPPSHRNKTPLLYITSSKESHVICLSPHHTETTIFSHNDFYLPGIRIDLVFNDSRRSETFFFAYGVGSPQQWEKQFNKKASSFDYRTRPFQWKQFAHVHYLSLGHSFPPLSPETMLEIKPLLFPDASSPTHPPSINCCDDSPEDCNSCAKTKALLEDCGASIAPTNDTESPLIESNNLQEQNKLESLRTAEASPFYIAVVGLSFLLCLIVCVIILLLLSMKGKEKIEKETDL